MASVQGLAERLTRVWGGRLQAAGNVPPDLRDDFLPGYTNAVLDLSRRYGVTWTSEREFRIDPPTGASAPVEPTSLVTAVTQFREDWRQAEREDRERRNEDPAPGYFLGYEQALRDIARELGFAEQAG
jgi:hypothetical protein